MQLENQKTSSSETKFKRQKRTVQLLREPNTPVLKKRDSLKKVTPAPLLGQHHIVKSK